MFLMLTLKKTPLKMAFGGSSNCVYRQSEKPDLLMKDIDFSWKNWQARPRLESGQKGSECLLLTLGT
jgi:hypothetical protein